MTEIILNIRPLDKEALMALLREKNIGLNEYAEIYMAHTDFWKPCGEKIKIVMCSLAELGAPDGCHFSEIFSLAENAGLRPCRPWMGPFLRFEMTGQDMSKNGVLSGQHRAPDGAITVFSELLESNDDFPKGMYLRNVDGKLWLRGYVCDESHLWSGEDIFAFEKVAGSY